jgi:hypothetical protein
VKEKEKDNTPVVTITSPSSKNKFDKQNTKKLYGTYDTKTNCITVTIPETDIPIGESIEEIICEVSEDEDDEVDSEMEYKFLSSTSSSEENSLVRELISPIASVLSDHLDTIHLPINSWQISNKEDEVKSVVSSNDYGYESLGSPNIDELYSNNNNDFDIDMPWNDSLGDLFPSLI